MSKQFYGGYGRGRRHNYTPIVRKNERIRAQEIRLIGNEGKMIGVMPTRDAQKLARAQGLDLVEISPHAQPPVCRIVNYGKYMYEQSKKDKDKTKHGAPAKIKEVKFHVNIDQHDYHTKLRHGEEFLFKGNKLRLTVVFRHRELEHKELGFNLMKRAVDDLNQVGVKEMEGRLMGRNISLILSPLPAQKRKLKFNEHLLPEPADSRIPDETGSPAAPLDADEDIQAEPEATAAAGNLIAPPAHAEEPAAPAAEDLTPSPSPLT